MKIAPNGIFKAVVPLLFFALTGVGTLRAQQTVSEALSIAFLQVGTGERPTLLGLRLQESIDEELWEFQFSDPKYENGKRLITIRNGKFHENKSGGIWPFTEGGHIPFVGARVTQKLSDLRRQASSFAAEKGIKPSSITYVLGKKIGDRDPVWTIYFLKKDKVILGFIKISSLDGAVLGEKVNESR